MSGEQYDTHLFSYRFEGAEWGLEIVAKDEADAKERMKALAWAKYDGVLVATIPSVAPRSVMGPLLNVVARVRNWIHA